MSTADLVRTPDFKNTPYWWEAGAIPVTPPDGPIALTRSADVVVIGGGVTGVEAARVLANAGRHVVVLDAAEPGHGASSRNAGQIGRNFKHSFGELMRTRGIDVAKRYFGELRAAYDAVADIGAKASEAIGWRKCGRVVGAMSPALFEKLKVEYLLRAEHIGEEVEIVPPDEIAGEMNSHLYKGAVRILENGAVHPALYYRYLRDRAESAGAMLYAHTTVLEVKGTAGHFKVRTSRGDLTAGAALVATNGYTNDALPWFKKRLGPIDAYMVATEPMQSEAIREILPRLRTYHDNRRRSHYMSVSPDGTRLLFGGRTGRLPSDLAHVIDDLQSDMGFIFRELRGVRLSHGWTGRCAGTRDLYPHVGVHQGVHFALGYCFSGMAMGPHLARKAAARIIGDQDGAQTIFETPDFPALPLLARGPWLGPVVAGYWGWADRPAGLQRAI